jgi:uncharacterized protein (TIGR02453 family)
MLWQSASFAMIQRNEAPMSNAFDQLIPDAQGFLTTLSANNTRDWWGDNKQTYDDKLKSPSLLLLDVLSEDLRRDTGCTVVPKLFRPHRDVRFSKDKTPYQTHLHMMWKLTSGTSRPVAVFFGVSPEYVRIGGGIMDFTKPSLLAWRAAVDRDADAVTGIVSGLSTEGYEMDEPTLKRVPAPFDKEHPNGDLLKHKKVVMSRQMSGVQDLRATLRNGFSQLQPLVRFLHEM